MGNQQFKRLGSALIALVLSAGLATAQMTITGTVTGTVVDPTAQVVAGAKHTCARTTAQTVYCWGQNDQGQLGNGGTSKVAGPVQVQLPTGVDLVAIGAGAQHTCVVRKDGTVWCWGSNKKLQLGLGVGSPAAVATPTLVPASLPY